MSFCQVELRLSPPGRFPIVWRDIGSFRHCYVQLQMEGGSAHNCEIAWEDRVREWHAYWWIPTDDQPGGMRGAVRPDSRGDWCETEAATIRALVEWFHGQPAGGIAIQRRYISGTEQKW